eukprot:TRINITY_DN51057_c0_g1_i1.p1 TRINITY_DN51057_c0_g1~~TRINITY_DN51057_c0_g1_i1.p1  ORF type:complete len:428 (+),score=73.05 TRINITY_DN51057_c0_g1_i1:71-1285(+)
MLPERGARPVRPARGAPPGRSYADPRGGLQGGTTLQDLAADGVPRPAERAFPGRPAARRGDAQPPPPQRDPQLTPRSQYNSYFSKAAGRAPVPVPLTVADLHQRQPVEDPLREKDQQILRERAKLQELLAEIQELEAHADAAPQAATTQLPPDIAGKGFDNKVRYLEMQIRGMKRQGSRGGQEAARCMGLYELWIETLLERAIEKEAEAANMQCKCEEQNQRAEALRREVAALGGTPRLSTIPPAPQPAAADGALALPAPPRDLLELFASTPPAAAPIDAVQPFLRHAREVCRRHRIHCAPPGRQGAVGHSGASASQQAPAQHVRHASASPSAPGVSGTALPAHQPPARMPVTRAPSARSGPGTAGHNAPRQGAQRPAPGQGGGQQRLHRAGSIGMAGDGRRAH